MTNEVVLNHINFVKHKIVSSLDEYLDAPMKQSLLDDINQKIRLICEALSAESDLHADLFKTYEFYAEFEYKKVIIQCREK